MSTERPDVRRAAAALHTTTATAPSPMPEHMYRVRGPEMCREARTCATESSWPYCAIGFNMPLRWFFAATSAKSSDVAGECS